MSVIVMNRDPQVLKGLVLLLEDMQFKVTSACNEDELENINDTQTDCPALLLLPLELDKGHSGIELVTRLRTSFGQRIPAILLSHESGFGPDHFVYEDIVLLSDHIKPKELRRKISTRLRNELAV